MTESSIDLNNKFIEWVKNLGVWGLDHGFKIIFIIIIAYLLKLVSKRFIQRIAKAAVASEKFANSESEKKRMNTIVRIFSWTINIIIVTISSMMVLQEFGVKIAPILASAGIVGVAVGFGGQYLVRDIITGFFLIFENQYRIDDVISIEGISGVVEDINLRVTKLRDMNGTVHYIPHGEIKKVSNLTKQFAKINLNIGISYNTNIDYVKQVIDNIGIEMSKDPQWKEMIDEAPRFLRIDSFDESCITIKIVGITKPQKQWDVAGELRKRIKETFDEKGIEFPFPQRVVHHINDKNSI